MSKATLKSYVSIIIRMLENNFPNYPNTCKKRLQNWILKLTNENNVKLEVLRFFLIYLKVVEIYY